MSKKANILVMGNSGTGKSTLINAVFNFDEATVGIGHAGTENMQPYEKENVSFRIIDTKGLEFGFLAQLKTKNQIKKWLKQGINKLAEDKYIHIIWYCVDATSKRLFDKNLDSIKNVAKMWKNIPIMIVLTKSYSETEISENIKMVKDCIGKYKNNKDLNIVDIIPVVAQQFSINNETTVPSIGVDLLVEKTNELLPEAIRINKESVDEFAMRIKRKNANALTIAATSGAAVVGAIPIPIADALILVPLQGSMIYGISKIYDIKKDGENIKNIENRIIGSGVVVLAAKTIITFIKGIPGLNIAASIINAVVAAIITAVIGEISITIMEKVAKGEIDIDDLEWMGKFADEQFMNKIGKYLDKLGKNIENKDPKKIGKFISDIFKDFNKMNTK